MRYKLLGRSGLRVSELCLGALTFGTERSYAATDKEECRRIFNTFAEAGGNFVDTADHYLEGTSEKWLGELLASDRQHFVVASKFSHSTRHGDPNGHGNHRKHMMEAVEGSLKRLGTDYLDLYWIHTWDFLTPLDEVMRALDDLVRQGKVLHIGASNTPAWIVSRANMMADLRGWTPFIGIQIRYSLMWREPERELLAMANELDLGVACYQPLGGSVLVGDAEEIKLRVESHGATPPNKRDYEIAAIVAEIAKEIGCSPAHVSLNWLRQQQGQMIPIVGARKVEHIEDNLGCLDFTLSDEQMQRLDEISKITPGHLEMLKSYMGIVYGGTYDSIDRHRPVPSIFDIEKEEVSAWGMG